MTFFIPFKKPPRREQSKKTTNKANIQTAAKLIGAGLALGLLSKALKSKPATVRPVKAVDIIPEAVETERLVDVGKALEDTLSKSSDELAPSFLVSYATPKALSTNYHGLYLTGSTKDMASRAKSAFERAVLPMASQARPRSVSFESRIQLDDLGLNPTLIGVDRETLTRQRDLQGSALLSAQRYLFSGDRFALGSRSLDEAVGDAGVLYRMLQTEGFVDDFLSRSEYLLPISETHQPSLLKNLSKVQDGVAEARRQLDNMLESKRSLFLSNYEQFLKSLNTSKRYALKAYYDVDLKGAKGISKQEAYTELVDKLKTSVRNLVARYADQARKSNDPEIVARFLDELRSPEALLGDDLTTLKAVSGGHPRAALRAGVYNLNHAFWSTMKQRPEYSPLLRSIPRELLDDATRQMASRLYIPSKIMESRMNSRLILVPTPFISRSNQAVETKTAFVGFSASGPKDSVTKFEDTQVPKTVNPVITNPLKSPPKSKSGINYNKNPFSFIGSTRRLIPNLAAIQMQANTTLPRYMRSFNK